MDFPPEWTMLAMEDFETATPRDPGELGMELMVQARATGRLMDHHRVTLGGTVILTANFSTTIVYQIPDLPNLNLKLAIWPREIKIRRNMTTSEWFDLTNQIASNDVLSSSHGSVNTNADLLEFFNSEPSRTPVGCSFRWAVGVGADGRMELCLQSLPASATLLNSKPSLKG